MLDNEFKTFIFLEMSYVGKALADPKRIQLIELLSQCPRNVEALAELVNSSTATTSHHLQILKQSNLASSKKDGKFIYYEATDFCKELWVCFSKFTQNHSHKIRSVAKDFFNEEEDLEELSYNQLEKLVKSKEIFLIDVRPNEEYENGHFPGAISVPLKSLHKTIDSLPLNAKIVAYCRGPYCVLSKNAVKILRKKGRDAFRLKQSILDFHQIFKK